MTPPAPPSVAEVPGELPVDRVVLRSLGSARAQRYYVYVPPYATALDTLLVAVHGISREAREQILAWRPLARALRCAVVAPVFERELTPGYQRLGWDSVGVRADRTLDAIVAEVQAALRRPSPYARLVLAGYSGGAQFCHRYALAYPQRVLALICGAAGWYTWPDGTLPWPLGTGPGPSGRDARTNLDAMLRIPTLVYVGANDLDTGASLRSTAELDALQGPDRRERARRWVQALACSATARGLEPRAELHTLPDVGHDFAAAVRAGAVDIAAAWLQQLRPLNPRDYPAPPSDGERHDLD